MNLLISFSGGRSSALLCKLILSNPKYKNYNKLFVFSNTGKELEQTLEFVNKCDLNFGLNLVWLESKVFFNQKKGSTFEITSFENANRNGKPFEEIIKKYGLPSKYYRHCTRELKTNPIQKFAKKYFKNEDYKTALGIRVDEPKRIKNKKNFIYPLVDFNIDEKFVREWWSKQSFDLKLKDYQGNCDLCFLKSLRKKITIIKEDKNVSKWWSDMEKKYKSEKQSKFDSQRQLTIDELVEKSKKNFSKAIDLKELRDKQHEFDFDLDDESNCFCNSSI